MGVDVENGKIGIKLQSGLGRADAYGVLPAQHTDYSAGAGITGDRRPHPLDHLVRATHVGFKGLSGVNPDQRNIQIKLVVVIFKAI
jgi:hypothetical protein